MSYYRKKEDVNKYLDKKINHQEIMDYNLEFLVHENCFKDYPYLKKVIARGSLKEKLTDFTKESREKLLNPSTDKQGKTTFFASNRHMSKTYKSATGLWNKAINIFYFLGLIEKITYQKLQHSQAKNRTRKLKGVMDKRLGKTVYPVTHYHFKKLDQETLTKANEQAKKLVENDFKIELFDKEWLAKYIGEAEANRVYPYDQEPTIHIEDEKIIKSIIKILEASIKENGYIKPKDLKELVRQDRLRLTPDPQIRKAINTRVNKVYKLELEEILKENGYKIINSNKELNKKYNLSGNGYPKIIVKRD